MIDKILIKNDVGLGRLTKVFNIATGEEIHRIRSITIEPLEIGEPVVAHITFMTPELDIVAEVGKIIYEDREEQLWLKYEADSCIICGSKPDITSDTVLLTNPPKNPVCFDCIKEYYDSMSRLLNG